MTDREAFEAWYGFGPQHPAELERDADGWYASEHVQFSWAAWQAATAAERERCAKVCEDYAEGSSYRIRPKLAEAIRKG